ncbi:MAG: rhomboid family intramembrane serine protease [Gemmatimonadetes bacterium]|nr:rhomboid family intramembrane serine protease [Gemmatimonadota bacterium]
MFPLHDDNPTEIFPLITLLLMAACVWVWWSVQGAGMSEEALGSSICTLGAIPAEVTGRLAAGAGPDGPCRLGGLTWQALFSSMFLHGSWMHLIGNMWFLWIFGNNVEDSMGHLRFLLFYVLTGLVAALAHVLTAPGSAIPMVGASGAISAIMGAYLLLYPRAVVHTLFFFVIFIRVIPLPAWVMLCYWIAIQIGSSVLTPTEGGGVAYAAHVGGFVAGLALILVFRNPKLVHAKRSKIRLAPSEIAHRGWW